jgi:hypothetical protein
MGSKERRATRVRDCTDHGRLQQHPCLGPADDLVRCVPVVIHAVPNTERSATSASSEAFGLRLHSVGLDTPLRSRGDRPPTGCRCSSSPDSDAAETVKTMDARIEPARDAPSSQSKHPYRPTIFATRKSASASTSFASRTGVRVTPSGAGPGGNP